MSYQHEWSGAEDAMLERVPRHLPDETTGVCTCGRGTGQWSLEHVVVSVWREAGFEMERKVATEAHARGVALGMALGRSQGEQ